MDKESLGIVWVIKKFAMYLYGKPFTLQTDHRSLQFLSASNIWVSSYYPMGSGFTEL